MSRVGKKPIPLPSSVKLKVGAALEVEGPKGKLTVPIPAGIKLEQKDSTLHVVRESDEYAAVHGLTRALTSNAVIGVSDGFKRELDIVGVGYNVESKGRVLVFKLGYSHPIEFLLPEGVDGVVEKNNHIVLSSHDRQLLGQTAANIRMLRPPEPYKQKGIRYTGEVLRKKVGKAGAGGKK
ncbi:MAG: 50S ribosomal protein L6 [Bryobacterales bacterium]|nr:50S ribosomal protein L6 [Bryobacterales bacterium]